MNSPFKRILLRSFETTSRIEGLKECKPTEPVLILGDGISSVYSLEQLKKYKHIICCNSSILNKHLSNHLPMYWVLVDPYFLSPRIGMQRNIHEIRSLLDSCFKRFPKTIPVFHSLGRIFCNSRWRNSQPIFISPHHEGRIAADMIYSDFTASLQACIGMALMNGFSEIHFSGFDAWMLSPKNSLRWYSRSPNPDACDHETDEAPPGFLIAAAKNCRLRVFTYRHYVSRFSFIEAIHIESDKVYIPERDRAKYMLPNHYLRWSKFESRVYPHGYEVKSV